MQLIVVYSDVGYYNIGFVRVIKNVSSSIFH